MWETDAPPGGSPSELYHETSKQRRHDVDFARRVNVLNASPTFHGLRAATFKNYPGAAVTALPKVSPADGMSFEQAVCARRSVRQFALAPVPLEQLARLVYVSNGLTARLRITRVGIEQPVRAVPSAGALFPVELYAVAERVDGLTPGIYHYAAGRHELESVRPGSWSNVLSHATSDPGIFGASPLTFVLTAVLARSEFKYGQRGYRFALLEAGHVCQNLLLGAVAAGLGAVAVGGFIDDEIHDLLELDGIDEVALYLVAVGPPKPPAPPETSEALAEQLLASLPD